MTPENAHQAVSQARVRTPENGDAMNSYYVSCNVSRRDHCDHQHPDHDSALRCAQDTVRSGNSAGRCVAQVVVIDGRSYTYGL